MKKLFILLICALIVAVITAGCRESAKSAQADDLQVTLTVEPDPPMMGQATLLITVKDKDGDPVNDAAIAVKGDMNHAGMVPVLGVAEGEAQDGVYRVPFEWTMGGDWILTVSIELDEDNSTERAFDVSGVMASGDMGDMDMEGTEEAMDMGVSMDAPLVGTPEDCAIADPESTEDPEDCAVPTESGGLKFP